MGKAFIIFGLLILLAVLLVNRLACPLSAEINIFLCAAAAAAMALGVIMRKPDRS